MDLPPLELGRIRELYSQGRYRQALTIGQAFGPIREWTGPAGRLIAGRLAIQLGAPRLGKQLHLVAFRESPAYLEAVYYHARYRLEHYGPLSCWRFQRAHADWSDAPPELRADWFAVEALCTARLRDFDRAERLLVKADAEAPNRAWVQVERASVLEVAERTADALASARRSLELHPWFRPGVQAVAHLLQRGGREAEAIELLTEAAEHLESGVILAHLAALQLDTGRWVDARRSLDRYADLSPLLEPDVAKWLAARRADVLYLLGEPEPAAANAKQVEEDFYTSFAQTLDGAEHTLDKGWTSPRTLLTVDLSPVNGAPPSPHDLLARFWNVPLPPNPETPPPLDGLPDAADRRRFDQAGWVTREFVLCAETTLALIQRGVPFLVTLVETGFGQSRFVLGADPLRGSLFVIEGPDPRPAEAPVKILSERYRAFGPRCLVAVPAAEAHRLDGLAFPDSDAHDRLHVLQTALLDHQFADAKARLAALRTDLPNHRLTKFAAIAWARATAHPVLLLDALNDLLADYPHDSSLILSKSAVLRDLGRTRERLDLLTVEGDKTESDAILMQSLAQLLLPEPHRQYDADRLLRRSVRVRPHAAAGYYLLASQRWEHQQFPEAVELYRMAACLDDREEQFAEAYAKAATVVGQSPEPLRLFQQKATRAAQPYPPAVRALYAALFERDEPAQAFAALGKAIEKLQATETPPPELGELLLFRAEQRANFARFADAEHDLAAAKPLAPPVLWHRSAARVARTKPDYPAALAALRELVKHDPLSADAHRLTAQLLADTQGRAVARTYLADLVQRFPDMYPLVKLRAEFLYPDQDDAATAATQALIDLCPHDAWANRQLALILADRKRIDEAMAAVNRAAADEPDHPSHFAVLAHVHRRADRIDEALATFRSGLELYPDHDVALFELVQLSRGLKEKKDSLRFIAEQLHAKPHTGDGLLAYFGQSAPLIDDPDELELFAAELDRFLDERPDLWQAWSVNVQAKLMDHQPTEAASLAQEEAERFPLVARVWVDVAETARAAGHADEALDALRQAASVAPAWVPAVREYADALAEANQEAEAIELLERLVARTPLDPQAHWNLAERLWHAGRSRDALDRAKMVVRHDTGTMPRVEVAWPAVMNWSDRLDVPDEPLELARELTRDRAGDPRAWLQLARCLHEPGRTDEALAALEHAIRLDPRNVDAHDQKAERLAFLGRFDEALEAARPSVMAGDMPMLLQGRAAWVEARRGNYAAAIPPMQALVSVDPDYVWGWQQLAEWYNETSRPENYLEAASELARLRPDHPLSLTMRGEAKIQTGDRDGGKADLRDALRVHPGFSPAAQILFDACLADRELREARTALAVLQEHLTGQEVLLKQLQYAARTGDEDGATRAFNEICQTPGEGPPLFINLAFAEMHSAGLQERATQALSASWRTDEPFNPWAAIYWLDTPAGDGADPDERLAACDAIIKAYPQFVLGYDRRAEQLALMDRFDEAAAACAPPQLGPPVPIALRGRAAWVEAQRGDRMKAIALMRQLVTEEPDYSWGWRQLSQWYDLAGKFRDYLDAADHLVRLNPDDPVAHTIRGEARRALGDHDAAKDDYRRAFDLDPTFEAAGLQLIATQLTTNDILGAARTLEVLKEHASGPLVGLRAVQVAARQGDLATARTEFRELCIDPSAGRGLLREAATALTDAGWEAEADEELSIVLADPETTAAASGLWVERMLNIGEGHRAADRFPAIIETNREAGREAVLTYAWALASAGPPDAATATIQRHADLLRSDDEGWARAGATLAEARNYALAAAWLADWRDRPGCRPWMLRPLAEALRALDRDVDADRLIRAVVEVADGDEVPTEFRAWLAVTAAVEGRTDEASEHLREADSFGQPDGVKLLLAMAEAVVMVQQAGPAGKRQAFADAKELLRVAAHACSRRDVPAGAARWYRRVTSRLAADAGTLPAKLWALWQRAAPWVK